MQPTKRFWELSVIEAVPSASCRAPLLFVHGGWGGSWVLERFMEVFAARGYPCVAINLRAYHDSKPVADIGKVTLSDHIDDIRSAVRALGAPIVITHSASGHFALKLSEELELPAMVHLVPTPP